MAHAMRIDTLEFSKSLQAAGADEKLAEAIVKGITGADTSELATKDDLKNTETLLKSEISEVQASLESQIVGVRTEIAGVKSDLKWMKGIGAAILAAVVIPMLTELL